jgi:hypothetical protein
MLTEPAKELNARKSHLFLPVVTIIMVFKPYSIFINRKKPVVADGCFMGIAAKVFHHLFGSTKWFFGIYYPGSLVTKEHTGLF